MFVFLVAGDVFFFLLRCDKLVVVDLVKLKFGIHSMFTAY